MLKTVGVFSKIDAYQIIAILCETSSIILYSIQETDPKNFCLPKVKNQKCY